MFRILTAWFKSKYPDHIIGGWSSSGVINAVNNFDNFDYSNYNVQTVIDPTEFSTVEDQIAHDVVQSLVSAGADVEVQEHACQIAHCFHTEFQAFLARDDARRSGARVAPSIHSFRPRSELSFEERQQKL